MALKVYNIKTDFAAVGNGQLVTATITIANGSKNLSASTNLWAAGDVGKHIAFVTTDVLPDAVNASFGSTIATFTDAQHIVLNDAFTGTSLVASSQQVEWGSDDSPAFASFNAAALTWQAAHPGDTFELDIPAGIYEFISLAGGQNQYFANGISQLTVVGAGASSTTLSDLLYTGSGFTLGAVGATYPVNNPGAGQYPGSRVQSVGSGSNSVSLITPSESSRFNIGDPVLMGGVDLQGFGAPQNLGVWEYATVGGVSGGTVSFTAPLANSYKSSWPLYNAGDVGHPDCGGPASLFPLVPSFNITLKHQDFTVSQQNRQTSCNGKNITLLRVTALGVFGIICSQQATVSMTSVVMAAAIMEFDKIVGIVTMSNVTINQLAFQSPGANLLSIDSSTITTINGTPTNLVVTNSTVGTLKVGCYSYGASFSLSCSNCTISALTYGGVVDKNALTYTMTNGVISHSGVLPWAVPGAKLFWSGAYQNEGVPFTITDLTIDGGGNTLAHTSLPGGFPPLPQTGGQLWIQVHPGPNVTFTNCTGCVDVVDLSQAPPGAPLYSYSKRTFTGAGVGTPGAVGYQFPLGTQASTTSTLNLWGKLKSIKYTVSQAYTGINNPLYFHGMGAFDNYPTIKSDGSISNYGPHIDLRATGQRVVTPAAVTGAQPNDTGLSVPEAVWFPQGSGLGASADISGESSSVWPIVTVEWQMDQGIPSFGANSRLNLGIGLGLGMF